MRYTDFTKTQNKKALSLLEREDKQAGSLSVKPVGRGNVDAGVGAPVPAITRPVTETRAAVIVGSFPMRLAHPAIIKVEDMIYESTRPVHHHRVYHRVGQPFHSNTDTAQ
jgi:hypothetical protein